MLNKTAFFIFIFFIFIQFSCKHKEKKNDKEKQDNVSLINGTPINKKTDVRAEVFHIENGWGYDIYIGEKRFIHQKIIPAISGIHHFSSKKKAKMAGEYVADKVRNSIFPPTVTEHELDSLKVLD